MELILANKMRSQRLVLNPNIRILKDYLKIKYFIVK